MTGNSFLTERQLATRSCNLTSKLLLQISAETQTALDQIGLRHLARHGITNEPFTWQPPLRVAEDLGLQIPPAAGSTIETLWTAATEGLALGSVAPTLGLTSSQAALLYDEHRPSRATLRTERQGRKLSDLSA